MDNDNYELMPLDEVRKLKQEISELKKEKHYAPSSVVAQSLDRLANSLESMFKIFEVAATDIEQESINKKSFEEHINPIMERLDRIEDQNKDIAEGMLALADIVKKLDVEEEVVPYGRPIPVISSAEVPTPQSNGENGYPAPRPLGELPPMPTGGIPPPMPGPFPR